VWSLAYREQLSIHPSARSIAPEGYEKEADGETVLVVNLFGRGDNHVAQAQE
jgi:hypothetical protein